MFVKRRVPGISVPIAVILSGISAVLMDFAAPAHDCHFIAWIALVPLILVLYRTKGPVGAFTMGLISGWLFFTLHLDWTFHVNGFSKGSFVLSGFSLGTFIGFFGLFSYIVLKRTPGWALVCLPAFWTILEYTRHHMGFLSFPWGTMAYTQYKVPAIASISTVTGIFGISFFIVFVNTFIALKISRFLGESGKKGIPATANRLNSEKLFCVIVILFFGASMFYGILTAPTEGEGEVLKVAVVQGNAEIRESHDKTSRDRIFSIYEDLTVKAARSAPEVIVWPAASVPGGIPSDVRLVKKLADLAERTNAHLLVGSSGYEKFRPGERERKRIANSAFLFTPTGEITARYDKIRLLPFDEYLPLRGKVRWPRWIVDEEMVDTRPGKDLTVMPVRDFQLGVQICWENMFPGQFRKYAGNGLDLMVSMTNEAFAEDTSAHYQMLAMNIFRAVENRISIVRSAPTGISAIIDPSGSLLTTVKDEYGKVNDLAGFAVKGVALNRNRTVYNRSGDWFIVLMLLLLLIPFKELITKRD